MKKFLFFMFSLLFLATSCTEDSLQEVSFGTSEIRVGTEAQTLMVSVVANCPWVISGGSDRAYFNSLTGTNSSTLELVIFRNSSFDERRHEFVLTSEDGSSSARLVVIQDARIKMEMSSDGIVPAKGGNFNVYLNTNDNIDVTDVPEWVTYVSGRAVEKHTYTLECMPNRTGKPRTGNVVFTGRHDTHQMTIKQDSYTPDSIQVHVPASLIDGLGTYRYQVSMFPVYSDEDKLTPVLEGPSGSTAEIDGGYLSLSFTQFGEYDLSIFSSSRKVWSKKITVWPTEAVINFNDGDEVCLGDVAVISDEHCSLRFSNNGIVQKQDKKINVATGTVTEGGMQSVMYYSPEELVPATYADPVSVLLGRYTVHFIATINGQTHHTFANF